MQLDRPYILRSLMIAAGYIITGYLGLMFPYFGTNVTLIWAPLGIALGALTVFGSAYAPAVFAAALLTNLITGAPPMGALLIAFGNTAAALLPALAIRRIAGSSPLLSLNGMAALVGFGILGGPAISASCGAIAISFFTIGNFGEYTHIWQGWWLGDFIGALIVAPMVIRLLNHDWKQHGTWFYGELAFVTVTAIIVSSAVQSSPLISSPEYLFIFVSVPFVLWAGTRFGLFGATIVNAAIVFDIIFFAVLGESSLVRVNLNIGLQDIYGYVAAMGLATLCVAAAIERIMIVTARTRDGRISSSTHRLRRNLALVIGVLGFSVSTAAALYTYRQISVANAMLAEQYRRAFDASLREELGRATDSLIAVRTLFDVHGSVSANTFDAMIGPWVERRPSVAALQWAPHVTGRARRLLEETAPLQGVENFTIRQLQDGHLAPAAARDEYYPIYYAFPRSGHEEAVGFDMLSVLAQRQALQIALRTGDVTLTDPLPLFHSGSSEVFALALLSVPNRVDPAGEPLGVAIGVLRLTAMITRAALVARLPSEYQISLADFEKPDDRQIIYANIDARDALAGMTHEMQSPYNPRISTFSFGHRDWTIMIRSPESSLSGLLYWQPWAIFVFGAAISLLLMTYLRSLTQTEKRIVDLVYQRTRELDNARREAEEAMTRAQQADTAKSEFIAHMSHEFRSPLTSILGYAQLAEDAIERKETDGTVRNYIGTINAAGRHVLALIGDVLDLSKIEAGKLTLEEVPTDIHAICEEVVSMMMVPAHTQNNRLHLELPDDLPRRVMGDPTRIRQVLTNLVSNAIKFTRNGNIHVIARLLDATDSRVKFRLEVSDEGIGIPVEKLQSIFEAFSQVDTSTTRRFGGTGLGLAISQKMVLAMGGTIHVSSRPDRGSLFWFDLDLPRNGTGDDAHMPETAETPADTDAPLPVTPRHLLLVEDIQINRILAQKLLEQQGHSVTSANDGQDALDKLQDEDFDAVLMDVHMPGMDGIEATRRLRDFDDAIKATIPVLALTADTSSDNLSAFRQAGMDAHCTKPLDIAAINRELDRLSNRMLAARRQQLADAGE